MSDKYLLTKKGKTRQYSLKNKPTWYFAAVNLNKTYAELALIMTSKDVRIASSLKAFTPLCYQREWYDSIAANSSGREEPRDTFKVD